MSWHRQMFATAEGLGDRYEDLRQEVLSNEIGSTLGLSVFLRQGMVGWMQVQSFVRATHGPAPPRRREPAAPLPKGMAAELTKILTELIVTRKELSS